MSASSQALWVNEAIAGDAAAYGHLVRAYSPTVCAITLAITRDVHSSEEVAQDVFVLAWSRLHQLQNPASFGPWLRQLCRNRSREFLRSRARRERRTQLDNEAVARAASPKDPAALILDAEEERLLAEAIAALPDDTREVLILYYREGQSVRQVAELLELSEAAVRKRLSRARGRLREDIAERFGGVVKRTAPGVGLTLMVLERLTPRVAPLAAAGTTSAGAAAALSVFVAACVALLFWGMGGVQTLTPWLDRAGSTTPSLTAPPVPPPEADGGTSEGQPASGALSDPGLASGAGAGAVVVEGEGHIHHPVFSPHGDYLAYEVNGLTTRVDLYVAPVEGEAAIQGVHVSLPGAGAFSDAEGVAMNTAWHPSDLMVFEGASAAGVLRLFYHQPGSGVAAELIPRKTLRGNLSFPALSAEGDTLALVSDHTGNGDIYTRETASGVLTQQTDTPASESFPLFSADGSELLFSRRHQGTDDVLAKRLADGVERQVIGGAGHQSRPNYAGQERIVYFDASRAEGVWDLMSIDAQGSEPMPLGRDVRLPLRARPAVSADGQWVAYTSGEPTPGCAVHLVKVDGSEERAIRTRHTACGEPALSEHEGRVLLAYTALPESGSEWRFLEVLDITTDLQ